MTAAAALGKKQKRFATITPMQAVCWSVASYNCVSPFSGRGILGLRDCEGCLVWWDLR